MRAASWGVVLWGLVASVGACSSDGTSSRQWPSNAAGAGGAADGGAAGTGATVFVDAGGTPETGGDGGLRLVPWQLEAEGTAPLVNGIYDRQEKVHCRFLLDEAGRLRCLPWGLAPLSETSWFSDAACQRPIYRTNARLGQTLADRPTALPLRRVSCAPRRYAVGKLAALPSGSPRYGGTPCAPLPTEILPDDLLSDFSAEELQPPDRWATGAEVDGPLLAGRWRVKEVQTADGARFTDHFVDERWNQRCHIAADLGAIYCRPTVLTETVANEGETCTGPRVYQAAACDPPAYLQDLWQTYALGPKWTGPLSNNYGHGGCSKFTPPTTPDGPAQFLERGAVLPDARMPARSWAAGGSGRLRLRGLGDDAGALVPVPSELLWSLDFVAGYPPAARYDDAVAGESCNPIRTPEGVVRCVRTSVVVVTAVAIAGFADPSCKDPVYWCPNYTSCPGIRVAPATLDANGELRASSLSTARSVTQVFQATATGPCEPSSDAALSTVVFAAGAAVPWDEYPVLGERNGRAADAP